MLKRAPLIRFVPAKYTGMLSQHMCCWETNVVGTWLQETQNHNRAARYQNSESTGISSRHYRLSCQWVTRLSGQHKLISFITILCHTVQNYQYEYHVHLLQRLWPEYVRYRLNRGSHPANRSRFGHKTLLPGSILLPLPPAQRHLWHHRIETPNK